MVKSLQFKDDKNAQKLLDAVYDVLEKEAEIDAPEIACRIRFFYFNTDSKKYECIYYGDK